MQTETIQTSQSTTNEYNEWCKSIAKEKTKDWVIGETGFRFLGTGFVWCFQGIDEEGNILGQSWPRKTRKMEYFKYQMTSLKDVRKYERKS